MLPRKHRLKSKKEIDELFKSGKAVRNSFLFLKYKENNLESSRFAFSVGLKYSKKAVERNNIKRTLRESLKPFLKSVKPGYDGTFFLSQSLDPNKKRITQSEAQDTIKKILEKANLLIIK
ncbi:MAG: ribonuclease P protein component [Patescibacteria group bacterium]|jgi:ribonuclease P protein component|nr:ribonuclease P protein component [Patescibacteria group bacterium]